MEAFRISFEKAKELSVRKWTTIIEDGGVFFPSSHRDLLNLVNYCGFCHRYLQYLDSDPKCWLCEISTGLYHGCYNSQHLHYKWASEKNDIIRLEYAKQILDLIINAKPNQHEEE